MNAMKPRSKLIIWSADYKPFGEASVTANAVENNFRFPGQYYDGETGLHYNWHRYYGPETGRYLRADPSHSVKPRGANVSYLLPRILITPQEVNPYQYCYNNPARHLDPLGLSVLCKIKCYVTNFLDIHYCNTRGDVMYQQCFTLFANNPYDCIDRAKRWRERCIEKANKKLERCKKDCEGCEK